MGYSKSHAIVVQSWDKNLIHLAHKKALTLFDWVSPICPEKTNGFRSFFIPPDGSNEGWQESNVNDHLRECFKSWLKEQIYNDGSTKLTWVEVVFDDDNVPAYVEDSDDKVA